MFLSKILFTLFGVEKPSNSDEFRDKEKLILKSKNMKGVLSPNQKIVASVHYLLLTISELFTIHFGKDEFVLFFSDDKSAAVQFLILFEIPICKGARVLVRILNSDQKNLIHL